MKLGVEVGLIPGDTVLDGDPAAFRPLTMVLWFTAFRRKLKHFLFSLSFPGH